MPGTSKPQGIELINELGNIRIKLPETGDQGGGRAENPRGKKLSITGNGSIKLHAAKNIKIACSGEVKLKGKNIQLQGAKGVTTEGKQIAAAGDAVMGFDVHLMEVPAGLSTAVVPLPHLYKDAA
jgi:hypothetical protein